MKRAQLVEAQRLFTAFHGARPSRVTRVSIPVPPRAMAAVGECIGIMYRARRDGNVHNFLHKFFRSNARPTLAASPDGRTLYLLGGAYRFTNRGIEDALVTWSKRYASSLACESVPSPPR
jgi:hypothetical protein